MPTQTQISSRILRGQLLQGSLAKADVLQEKVGNMFSDWEKCIYVSQLVEGLYDQYEITDYTSDTTVAIYNKLGGILGMQFIDGAALDPNAQQTDVIIAGSFPAFNETTIYFTGQTTVSLSNYQASYAGLYGNTPFLAIYTGTGGSATQDTSTVPTINFVGGVQANGIDSIIWTYPVATSGYITILGAPAI